MRKALKTVLCVALILALTAIVALRVLPPMDTPAQSAAATPTPVVPAAPTPTPEPTPLQFTTVDASYFDDALFIGDSRTVGIAEYGNLKNATYFADVGLNVYVAQTKAVAVKNVGTVTLPQLLSQKTFGKVYIMLGINELGNDLDDITAKFSSLIDAVRAAQPNAIVYVEANLHVGPSRSSTDATFNNPRINRLNEKLAARIEALPETADVLVYIGQTGRCFGADSAISFLNILDKAKVGYTTLKDEPPTGALLGDMMGMTGDVQSVAVRAAEAIKASNAEKVVVLSPYDAVMLREQYAKWSLLDGIEIVSAPAFLAELISGGRLSLRKADLKASLQENRRSVKLLHFLQ